MIKKPFLVIAALCASVCAYAEKPFMLAVTDDLSAPNFADESDNRTASLMLEYYKSELATRSRLKLVSVENLADALEKINQKRGTKLSTAQIQNLCGNVKADILILTSLTRGAKNGVYTASIYNAKGKLLGTLRKEIDNIKRSDVVSVSLARDTARTIRGDSPVDKLNQQREQQMMKEVDEDLKSEQKRAGRK